MTKAVPTAGGGTGVAGFRKEAKGVTPPSKPGRQGVFLTDVIVELGFADQKKIDAVVETARNSAKTVEALLLESGAIDEDQLSLAIAERSELDHVDLERFEVDVSATEKITRSMCLRHRAVPIAFAYDGALIVAVADPLDPMTICDFEEMTKSAVRLAIATPGAIHRLLERPPDESPQQGASVLPRVDSKQELKPPDGEAPVIDEPKEDAIEPDPLPEAPAASGGDEDSERAVRRAQRVEGELLVARRQIADFRKHIAKHGSQSPELKRQNAELERRSSELERRIAQLEAQKGELAARKGELEAQNGQFERQNAQLKLKLTELVEWASEVVSVARRRPG